MSATHQNYQVVGEKIRDECMALLSDWRGSKSPTQPERTEVLTKWPFETALDRAKAEADEKLQELKRVLNADRELVKQRNIQAVSDFFDRVASGKYKRKSITQGTPKRKYSQRKRPDESTKKRTAHRIKQEEEFEMQQDDFYDQLEF